MKKTSIYFKIVLFKTPLFFEPSWWNLLEESKKKYTTQNVFYKRFSLTRAMRRVSRVPSNQDQWCQPSTNSQHRGWKKFSRRIPGLIHKNLLRATAMNLRQTQPLHNCCCCILVCKIRTRLQSCLRWLYVSCTERPKKCWFLKLTFSWKNFKKLINIALWTNNTFSFDINYRFYAIK